MGAEPQPAASARASQRQFQSQLEQRHTDSVHSQLESQHIEAHVQPVSPTIVAAASAPSIARTSGDRVLHRLVQDRPMLARVMVLGMVLGPPLGLGDEERRI
jgi:hypothetical protein